MFYKQWFHAKKYGKNGEVTIRINLASETSMNLRVTFWTSQSTHAVEAYHQALLHNAVKGNYPTPWYAQRVSASNQHRSYCSELTAKP